MADQRLPTVGSDDGQWGTILNQFLATEHETTDADVTQGTSDNGRHKKVTIIAGTAAAGTAPLKFTSGTVLTTPEAGAMEFNSDSLYFTTTTGPTRKTVAWADFSNISGTLGVANGGTGATTLTGILKGNGTSAFTAVTAPTGDIVGTTDTQTLSNKTLTTPKIADAGSINDANGNEYIVFSQTTSAVNEITVTNAAAAGSPKIAASGETNVTLTVDGKGTGGIQLGSSATGDIVAKIDLDMEDEVVHFDEYDNGNSGTADTIDWNNGQKQKSTLTGNCTYTFTAPPGHGNFVLRVIQDATGSRTVLWPSSVKWPGGSAPTLSTAANSIDIISFYYDGTNYYGVASLDFS